MADDICIRRRRIFTAHTAAMAALVLSGANASSAVPIVGAGHLTCAKVLEQGPEKVGKERYAIRITSLGWVQGYLTARAISEDASKAPSAETLSKNLDAATPKSLAEYVETVCKADPTIRLEEASFKVYKKYGGQQFTR